MKTLIVYYSFEGNTKLIAESIAGAIQADILELKPENEPKTKSFLKYLWGGKEALKKAKPALLPFDTNPDEYDMIFIGTPVWAFTYTPPLNTFFSTNPLSNKKIALFCCHGGGKRNTLDKMKTALPGNNIIGENDFFEPLKKDSDKQIKRAQEWAEWIINSL